MNPRKAHLIREEQRRIQVELANASFGHRVRCIISVARSLLLEGPYHYNGRWCEPQIKHLGAGVYDVWLKENDKV